MKQRNASPAATGTTCRLPFKTALFVFFCFLVSSSAVKAQNCTINAGVDETICANGTLTLTGVTSGLFAGGSAAATTWSKVSGPEATIISPSSLQTAVTGFVAGTYVFQISTTCLDGSAISDDVAITVLPIVQANAGSDLLLCPGSGYNLSGNSPGSGTGKWTVQGSNSSGISIGASTSPTSSFTLPASSAGSSTVRWTITQGACSSYSEIVVTNRGGVTPVSAGPDQNLSACYTSSTSATLNGSQPGANGQSGTWTFVSGPTTPTITNAALRTSTVTNLVQGQYILRWTVSGPCVTGSSEVRINVPAPTTSLTGAGSNTTQSLCDSRTTTFLSGTTPTFTGEVSSWTQKSGPSGAVIASPTSPATTVTGLDATSTYVFTYTIVNTTTGCSSKRDETVSFTAAPSITVNGGNKFITLACNATSVSVPYTVSGGATSQYRVISGPAGYALPGSFTTASANAQTVSGLTVPGTYVVRFQRTAGVGCTTAYDDVHLVVSRSPTASVAGTPQILACNVFSTSLAGNIPVVGSGSWSQVSGPNTAVIANPLANNTALSGLTNGKYLFKWIISGGSACAASEDLVSVAVASTTPTAAAAGADRTVCNGSPVTLAGNQPLLNETGLWTVTPSAGVSFSDPASPTAVVNGLKANTTYTFSWTISNACGSTSDEMVLTTTSQAGPAQANAGVDQCLSAGTATATLAANAPAPAGATGLWSQVSGPNTASFVNSSLANSGIAGLANGTYTFVWKLSLGTCTSTTDTVLVTISAPIATPTVGADQTICSATAALTATAPAVGTGVWTQTAGPGGATLVSPAAANSSVNNLVPGTYEFQWTVSNEGCASKSAKTKVFVSAPPSPADAGPDQTCLSGSSTVLAAQQPASGTGVWSQVSGPSAATISNLSVSNPAVTGLASGSYIFRWTVSGGAGCASSVQDVSVSVSQKASAGTNATLCNSDATLLTGNTGTTGTWSQVSGPSTATLTPQAGNTAIAANLVAGAYTFRYSLDVAPGCAGSFADKVLTVAMTPADFSAGANQSVCNATSFALAATPPPAGTGTWSKVSGPAGNFASTNNATTSFNGAVAGLYTFKWEVNNSGCKIADQFTILNSAPPSPAIGGPSAAFCGATTTLGGTAPAVGTGTWSQVSGPSPVSFTYPNLATSPVTGLSPGTYVLRWTVSSGACTPLSNDVQLFVCTPLPVRLLLFEAVKKEKAVQVRWQSADEAAFKEYVVERSVDGRNFSSLAVVAAKGKALNDYSYTDADAAGSAAARYYRLKLVDIDQRSSYSEIARVAGTGSGNLSIALAPNPVTHVLLLQAEALYRGSATLTITGPSGSVLLQQTKALASGKNFFSIPEVSSLPNGFYLLTLRAGGETVSQRFVIQR